MFSFCCFVTWNDFHRRGWWSSKVMKLVRRKKVQQLPENCNATSEALPGGGKLHECKQKTDKHSNSLLTELMTQSRHRRFRPTRLIPEIDKKIPEWNCNFRKLIQQDDGNFYAQTKITNRESSSGIFSGVEDGGDSAPIDLMREMWMWGSRDGN